jgi:hypothetical protein
MRRSRCSPTPAAAGVGEQCPQGTMLAGRANHGDCGRRTFIRVSVCQDRAVRMAHHGKPRAERGRVRCAALVPLDTVKRRMHRR